jgi:hypothetical protein
VTVLVTDAETRKPISTAVLRTDYPPIGLYGAREILPENVTVRTGQDGIARLNLPADKHWVSLSANVEAPGYLPLGVGLDARTVRAVDPAKPGAEPTFHLEMYAAPAPVIELVLPDGFRGPLLVKKADSREPAPGNLLTYPPPTRTGENGSDIRPGQRLVTLKVPPTGIVEVDCTGILRYADLNERGIRVRYANGTALRNSTDDGAIALRSVGSINELEYFVIGTGRDKSDASRLCHVPDGPDCMGFDGKQAEQWFKRHRQPPIVLNKPRPEYHVPGREPSSRIVSDRD